MRLLLLLCLLAASPAFAQTNSLIVADVRQSWATRQGTIKKATLTVRPKGIYMEYGLYLTFAAQGVTFSTNGDSLEVVLNFTLPEDAIVHDSWLWIGDDIVKARMYDRWTASAIYEGIVHRRQDPSILTKNSATQYQLRVFPMAKNSTRRVKITWLQPATFYANRTEMSLPFAILKTSKFAVEDFNLIVWPDDRFQNPQIEDQPDLYFEVMNDPEAGNFSRISLAPSLFNLEPHLLMSSPLQGGYYFSTYSEGGEDFYQAAVLPGYFLPAEAHRKVAVLFDYEASANAPTIAKLLVTAKSALLNNLEPSDSFNLFFSNLVTGQASDHWLPAHPDTILQVFANLNNPISSYSNLQSLLVTGIQWVQQHGADGSSILLASNSTQFSSIQAANPLINDFLDLLNPPVPIHVVDFNENSWPYFYANGTYYYANGYFLSTLAAQSGGSYVKTYQTQILKNAFKASLENQGAAIGAFELYPTLANGFCYGRFDIGNDGSTAILSKPALQVGKYSGEPPFHLAINGLLVNQPVYATFDVTPSDILSADTLLREMWYGRFVQNLEAEIQTSTTISSILYHSLNERVLSKYTAFLCLENLSWVCEDCEDETQYVSTEDLLARDSLLTAYPNPFTERTTLLIRSIGQDLGQGALELFSLDGRMIRRFDVPLAGGETRIEWDGADGSGNAVPTGMYLGMLRLGDEVRVLKLLKIQR